MSKRPHKPFSQSAKDIDEGLNGLFGALSDAISDVVAKLDDGAAGTVSRDHVFETAKGPIRAHAGVRLRMGGHDLSADQHTPERFDTNAEKGQQRKPSSPAPEAKPLIYDMIEDDMAWMITADVPGVSEAELTITQEGQRAVIETTGARRYAAALDLGAKFDVTTARRSLRNGILTLTIPKEV